jgi:hypothetical protein
VAWRCWPRSAWTHSLSIDDPELRQGAALTEATGRTRELTAQVTNALILASLVPTAPGDLAGAELPRQWTASAGVQRGACRSSAGRDGR